MCITEELDVKVSPLKDRRGVVRVSRALLEELDLQLLKLFYSNFFPFAIAPNYETAIREDLFYCYSEYFKEVSEATIAPEYKVIFKTFEGIITIDKVEEVTK